MITELAYKLITKYENLPPKKKALADMIGFLLSAFIASAIVVVVAYFGFWAQLWIGSICYLVWSLFSLLYKSRVSYYETQEKYFKNDKAGR